MALFDRPETPEFDVELRKLETSDKSHASLFNTMFQKLFINTLFLKKKTEANETAINTAYQNGNAYTDQKIAELVNGAPETLNTLKEVADAIEANEDVVTALNAAIGEKVKQTEFDTHAGNNTIHIAASERTKWNEITDVKAQVEENTAAISEQNKNLDEIGNTVLLGDFSSTYSSTENRLIPNLPDYKYIQFVWGYSAVDNWVEPMISVELMKLLGLRHLIHGIIEVPGARDLFFQYIDDTHIKCYSVYGISELKVYGIK